jgi:apolipoprotein N-acyltransferase
LRFPLACPAHFFAGGFALVKGVKTPLKYGMFRTARTGLREERPLRQYLPALASGIALVFSFPPFDLFPLAFLALVPFLVSLWPMTPGRAFKAGLFMGIPYFFGTQYWIYHSVHYYGGMPLVPSLAVVLLLSLYQSLYTGLFGLIFSLKMKKTALPALLLAPVLWVVLELLRSYAFTGFPWSSIGYSQYRFLPFVQFADITGLYGVSFMVVAVNGAVANLFLTRRRQQDKPLFHLAPTIIGQATLALALLAVFLYGHYRLNEVRPGHEFRAAVVQGNIRQDLKWDPSYMRNVMSIYEDLTASLSPLKPSFIVWPETALPFYFGTDAALTEELVGFQRSLDAYLLFGAITVKDENTLLNSAIMLDKSGNVSYTYDKIHMVPFGEYIPLKSVLFFLDKLVVGIGDYASGEEYTKAETPFGRYGTLICFEIIFPGQVRKFYKDGGDFIVNITNDAWFGETAGPYQHFSMAVFRAVENRKPVIRAANTGISGFIDSSGRIRGKTPLFRRLALMEDIRTDSTRTFYSRYGDLFAYLCIIVTVLLLVNAGRR